MDLPAPRYNARPRRTHPQPPLQRRARRWLWFHLAVLSHGSALLGSTINAESLEFFERKIRPVLVAECYDCHGADKQKGGLRLDFREGWQLGGDSGPALTPGNPGKSLLLTAIRHTEVGLEMPDNAPKLSDAVIADFERWIELGAPDPRDHPADATAQTAWPAVLATRREWWSLQPVSKPPVPSVKASGWSAHPVDRFLLAKMEAKGLAPAREADPHTLLRRLTYLLTGLPPTPADVGSFVAEFQQSPERALAAETTRLLASPRFGEHWARYWMDLVRYAETHGSEGDPAILQAWRYRDYLIRAFNADLPFDQLIREHLAGDLLPNPRLNPAGFNESILGTAHLRFVEHGFQPIDTLDDQVKVIDNQIDVVSKAFQALTISCARCHDHKFDAVSQRDFTAIYGIFASLRPAQVTIDTPDILTRNRAELAGLKSRIKGALAEVWLTAASQIGDRLRQDATAAAGATTTTLQTGADEAWAAAIQKAADDPGAPLHFWARLRRLAAPEFSAIWRKLIDDARTELTATQRFNEENFRPLWNLAGDDLSHWFHTGVALETQPVRAGEFMVTVKGEAVVDGLAPASVFTPVLSTKHGALLTSPRFIIATDSISVRAFGQGGAMVRVIVDNYPLPSNPIFPKATFAEPAPRWIRLDTAYRKGSSAYLEFATREELTRPLDNRKKGEAAPEAGRSFFGVSAIVAHDGKAPPKEEAVALLPLLDEPAPASAAELATLYQRALQAAVVAWRDDRLAEPQRALLDYFVRGNLLPGALAEREEVRPLLERYRMLENEIRVPLRAPGVIETAGFDAPLFARGDHLKPEEIVPRGYLEVIDPQPYRTAASGRLELSRAIASAENPLTARVMANRVWQWLFGAGLVPTVDNFGRLGELPTHPELLDFLASRLVETGWSLKEMLRFLVTTRAFQMSSLPSPRATETDPGNAFLSHLRIRRNGAEAIRDSLLAVSGELTPAMYGTPVGSEAPRRSIYVQVRRTALDPFLRAFDAPAPFSTLGRRDTTNVPAQSLTLLNSPFVVGRAAHWAGNVMRESEGSPAARVERMFQVALGRPPGADERAAALNYLDAVAREHDVAPEDILNDAPAWQELAHSIFNLKEFIYVR